MTIDQDAAQLLQESLRALERAQGALTHAPLQALPNAAEAYLTARHNVEVAVATCDPEPARARIERSRRRPPRSRSGKRPVRVVPDLEKGDDGATPPDAGAA